MIKCTAKILIKIVLITLLVIVLLIAIIDLFSVVALSAGYYMNWTTSMPIGFYKVGVPNQLQRGDDVMACLPPAIGSDGLHHEYLMPGKCPGGFEPIIKELVAVPGDSIVLSSEAITVNGKAYPAHTRDKDHLGRVLAAIPRGNYPNTQNYWLYGKNSPEDSWDSRYWGGVDRSSIIKTATPILTLP